MISEIIGPALILEARHRPRLETVLRRRKTLAQILDRRGNESENAFAAHKTACIGDVDERAVGNSVDEGYEARNLFDKLRIVLGRDDDKLRSSDNRKISRHILSSGSSSRTIAALRPSRLATPMGLLGMKFDAIIAARRGLELSPVIHGLGSVSR